MKWDAPLKPQKAKNKGSSRTQQISDLLGKTANNYRVDRGKRSEIRFSKLPVCGLLHTIDILGPTSRKVHFSQDFYTAIGTAVHETWQTHMPQTPGVSEHVWGDWKCRVCKKITESHCTTPAKLRCSVCKKSGVLEYSEIEVDYEGVKGHIDMILLVNGEYWMLDWKTTSLENIKEPSRYLPYPKNIMQIESYCWALKHQFDLTISYYELIYQTRDGTDGEDRKKREYLWAYGREVDESLWKLRKKQLDHAAQTQKQVDEFINNPTTKNLKKIQNNRPCHSRADYTNKQTGMQYAFIGKTCPFLRNCCGDEKWTRAAKTIWQLAKS